MTQVIVASFQEENKAIEALHKLNELDSFGDVSVYDRVLVRKKENGEYEILKNDTPDAWRTLTDMAIGGLVGVFAGPVGFLIGLYTGGVIGLVSDISHYNFEEDFIVNIENRMPAGTMSIIAEIEEDRVGLVDEYLKQFDPVILKSNVDFEYEDFLSDQIETIEEEISEERAGLKKSIGKDREKLQEKIASLKEKRKLTIAELEGESKKIAKTDKDDAIGMREFAGELNGIGAQIKEAINEAKVNRIKHRIARHEEKLISLHGQLAVLT